MPVHAASVPSFAPTDQPRRLVLVTSNNDPRKFLQTHEYKNLTRWTKQIAERPAVKRGRMVNRASGALQEQMHERHNASDFETKMAQG